MPSRASGSRIAIQMCPATTPPMASASQSWTKVAPVRHTTVDRCGNHISSPVPTITSAAPAAKEA
jgi:hypothetical protein